MLLVSDPRVEPVAMTGGGKCPADRTGEAIQRVRDQRRDHAQPVARFYPGYMYVLMRISTRSVRKKTPTRKLAIKEVMISAVINGVQAQWIQPLVIRGNQGDCVKVKLSNKLEGGEDVSLHIHGSAMVVSATSAAATTTNPIRSSPKTRPATMNGTSTRARRRVSASSIHSAMTEN